MRSQKHEITVLSRFAFNLKPCRVGVGVGEVINQVVCKLYLETWDEAEC